MEEYLGGPDADVEAPLKAFQDALAYALPISLDRPSSADAPRKASTSTWTAT